MVLQYCFCKGRVIAAGFGDCAGVIATARKAPPMFRAAIFVCWRLSLLGEQRDLLGAGAPSSSRGHVHNGRRLVSEPYDDVQCRDAGGAVRLQEAHQPPQGSGRGTRVAVGRPQ